MTTSLQLMDEAGGEEIQMGRKVKGHERGNRKDQISNLIKDIVFDRVPVSPDSWVEHDGVRMRAFQWRLSRDGGASRKD